MIRPELNSYPISSNDAHPITAASARHRVSSRIPHPSFSPSSASWSTLLSDDQTQVFLTAPALVQFLIFTKCRSRI
jgi:hypothetical protein